MTKKDNFWTDKNVKIITTMWNKGKTAADIADALGGITRNAVIGKANRLGLKKRPSPIKTISNKSDSKVKKDKVNKLELDEVNVKEEKVKIVKSKKSVFSILDVKEDMCRWPIGDPKDEDFHFCGEKIVKGCYYCEKHANIAYQVPNGRNGNK